MIMVRISLADLRSILDRELCAGIDPDNTIAVARHRRLTVELVKGEKKQQQRDAKSKGVATFVRYGSQKIQVIRVHRNFTGSGLREAKYWTEGDFSIFPSQINDLEFAKALEAEGAIIAWH